MEKLKSRKFWICVAAFLASIATSIAGIQTENQTIVVVGTVAGILSAAIYAFCEAWVDAASCKYDGLATMFDGLDEKEDNEE